MPFEGTQPNPIYNTPQWRRLRKQRMAIAKANDEPCCRCHRPIDHTLPGTVKWGPTCDHLNPLAQGGDAFPQLHDLAPAHRTCNSRHGARLGNRIAANKNKNPKPQNKNPETKTNPLIQQISGPPCAGKSSWIKTHAKPGDTILDDNDRLAQPAGGRDRITPAMWNHWYKQLDRAILNHRGPGTLWYIQGRPTPRWPQATVTLIDPGQTECHNRATRDNRPPITHQWIDQWYSKYSDAPTRRSRRPESDEQGRSGTDRRPPAPNRSKTLTQTRTASRSSSSTVTPSNITQRDNPSITESNQRKVTQSDQQRVTDTTCRCDETHTAQSSDLGRESLSVVFCSMHATPDAPRGGKTHLEGHGKSPNSEESAKVKSIMGGNAARSPGMPPGGSRKVTTADLVTFCDEGGVLSAPRFFTECHPDAAGSLAERWVPWLEGQGVVLRPWQRMFLWRVLEVDSGGRLLWRTVVCSTPRQSGKSVVLRAYALARISNAADLNNGDLQEVLFLSNNLTAARRIHVGSWRWAEDFGVTVKRAFGQERLVWPDGGHWSLSAANSSWGSSVNVAQVDECWDVGRDVVDEALWPTMVERSDPQLMLFSTANARATELVPHYRRLGLEGAPGVLVAEWGAGVGEDFDDPGVWRRAAAHWSGQRLEFMSSLRGSPGFAEQWLNVWPTDVVGVREWPVGWAGCPVVSGPVVGGVGALEVAQDRSMFGVASARVGAGGVVEVEAARFGGLLPAVEWLRVRSLRRVLVGLSVWPFVDAPDLVLQRAGQRETWQASALLAERVSAGLLRHNHDGDVGVQVGVARVVEGEGGLLLSGKSSRGPVETLKCCVWAVWGCLQPEEVSPKAAIF